MPRASTPSSLTTRSSRTTRGRLAVTVAVLSAVAAAGAFGAGAAASASGPKEAPAVGAELLDAESSWTPASTATVHPGVRTVTRGAGQCTANFVFTDAAAHVYLGQAAHCAGVGRADETDGCESQSLPLGTRVAIPDSEVTGKLAYSSWLTMRQVGERDADACAYNDFALVRIPDAQRWAVNPSVPVYGGPVGLNTTGSAPGDPVLTYGNSPIRQGIGVLSPKQGTSLGSMGHGWTHTVYTLTPGVPGDSGSAFLDGQGAALGVLSTLSVVPQPLSNQISDLSHLLRYAREYSGIKGLRLVAGNEPFLAGGIPA